MVLGIIVGIFLGYASSLLMVQNIKGYVVVVTIILMFILSRISSPKKIRKMSYSKVMFLNFLSGMVFAYGMVLLFFFIISE